MIQWRLFTRQIGLCLHCHYHLFLPVVPCHALHISSVMQRRRRPKLEDDTLSLPFTAPEEEEAYIKLSFEQMQRYFRVAKAVRAQTEAGKVSAGSIQEFLESNSATDDSVEGLSKMNLRSSRKRRRRQPEGNTTPKDFLDAEALFRLDRTYNATNNNSTTESYQLATTSVQDDVKDDGYTISEPTNEQKTSQENPIQEADSIIDNIERPLIPSPRSGSRKQSDEQPIREITFSLGKPRQMRRQRDEHWDASVRHRRVADSISSVIEAAIYQHHVNPLLVQANVTIYDVQVKRSFRKATVYWTAVLSNTPSLRSEQILYISDALEQLAPQLRRKIAQRLPLKHTPMLEFVRSTAEEEEERIEALLQEAFNRSP